MLLAISDTCIWVDGSNKIYFAECDCLFGNKEVIRKMGRICGS